MLAESNNTVKFHDFSKTFSDFTKSLTFPGFPRLWELRGGLHRTSSADRRREMTGFLCGETAKQTHEESPPPPLKINV